MQEPAHRSTPEAALTERLRCGDPSAFGEIYERFHPRLYSYLRRIARNPALADDLFQETWEKAAKGVRKLRADTRLEAWLFTVARNTYLSHHRWDRLRQQVPPLANAETPSTNELGLLAALDELAKEDRELLLLVADTELPLEAVAEVMNISYAALRKRLSRARAKLTDVMRHHGGK